MNQRVDFWCGVVAGCISSMVLFAVILIAFNTRLNEMSKQLGQLQSVQQIQESWIEENKTVMQTYKFFNESWTAILEVAENDNK